MKLNNHLKYALVNALLPLYIINEAVFGGHWTLTVLAWLWILLLMQVNTAAAFGVLAIHQKSKSNKLYLAVVAKQRILHRVRIPYGLFATVRSVVYWLLNIAVVYTLWVSNHYAMSICFGWVCVTSAIMVVAGYSLSTMWDKLSVDERTSLMSNANSIQ